MKMDGFNYGLASGSKERMAKVKLLTLNKKGEKVDLYTKVGGAKVVLDDGSFGTGPANKGDRKFSGSMAIMARIPHKSARPSVSYTNLEYGPDAVYLKRIAINGVDTEVRITGTLLDVATHLYLSTNKSSTIAKWGALVLKNAYIYADFLKGGYNSFKSIVKHYQQIYSGTHSYSIPSNASEADKKFLSRALEGAEAFVDGSRTELLVKRLRERFNFLKEACDAVKSRSSKFDELNAMRIFGQKKNNDDKKNSNAEVIATFANAEVYGEEDFTTSFQAPSGYTAKNEKDEQIFAPSTNGRSSRRADTLLEKLRGGNPGRVNTQISIDSKTGNLTTSSKPNIKNGSSNQRVSIIDAFSNSVSKNFNGDPFVVVSQKTEQELNTLASKIAADVGDAEPKGFGASLKRIIMKGYQDYQDSRVKKKKSGVSAGGAVFSKELREQTGETGEMRVAKKGADKMKTEKLPSESQQQGADDEVEEEEVSMEDGDDNASPPGGVYILNKNGDVTESLMYNSETQQYETGVEVNVEQDDEGNTVVSTDDDFYGEDVTGKLRKGESLIQYFNRVYPGQDVEEE